MKLLKKERYAMRVFFLMAGFFLLLSTFTAGADNSFRAEQIFDRYLSTPIPTGPSKTDAYDAKADAEVFKARLTRLAILAELKTMPEKAVSAASRVLFGKQATAHQRCEIVSMLGDQIHTRDCAELLNRVIQDIREPKDESSASYEQLVRTSAVHGLRMMSRRTDRSGGKRIPRKPDFEPEVRGLVPYLVSAANDKSEMVRISALYALADSRDPVATAELRNRLKDESEKVRLYAACFLTEYQDAQGLPEMRNALVRLRKSDHTKPLDDWAFETEMLLASFERITGKSFGKIPLNPSLSSSSRGEEAERYKELLDIWTEWWAKQDGETFTSLGLPEGNRVGILFQSMRDKTYTQGEWPFDFPALGWSDTPNLIKIAESERMLQSYPVNDIPSSSSFAFKSSEYPEGMIALWLIEGIRKFGLLGPKLIGKRLMVGPMFPSLNPICFEQGKANTTQEIHRKAYDAYSKWWRAVKDLPKEEAAKIDPLKGTGLDWWGRTEK